jgi:phosphoribosylaminoimidazolecarboxamide formyltransferase/IMP cyclohydrolase
MDLEAAWASLCEFPNETAAVIVKHAQPCGVAVAPTPLEAFTQALDCDPVSVFGGVVAFNEPVEAPVAKLLHSLFLEVIVAPAFSEEALAILSAKKNVRLVTRPWPTGDVLPASRYNGHTLRQLSPHLFLAQAKHHGHTELLLAEHMKIVTKAKPTHAQLQQMAFAWRVVKHVGSNAIVVANGEAPCSPDAPADTLYTVGLCGGRPSRVGAVEIALQQACDKATGSVLASDAFFPAIDSVELAAQHNVSAIIQPGGSIKDEAVIEACNRFGIAMVFTGVREFKH